MNAQINRSDIRKHSTRNAAFQSLNHYSTQHFVFLGNHNDTRPYWVVSAKIAKQLTALGYERA